MKPVVLVPVYNEEQHIEGLLDRLRTVYDGDVIFVDDGSQDCTPCVLNSLASNNVKILSNKTNKGYGATLKRAFKAAIDFDYDIALTMDSDGQHKPEWVPQFLAEAPNWDIVSGSRYKEEFNENGEAPADRKAINFEITKIIRSITGFNITDSFCGFKTYKVSALKKFEIGDNGYAMPLEVWIQAKAQNLTVTELPVSRIYDDPNRKFGGGLDNPEVRLAYYKKIIKDQRIKWKL